LYTLGPITSSNGDASGEGAKVAGDEPDLLIYIMVDSGRNGWCRRNASRQIAQPIGPDAPEITARFRDPAGNVLGLYQQS